MWMCSSPRVALDVITEAVTLHAYSEPLCSDYERYTTGEVLLETADRLVSEEGSRPRGSSRCWWGRCTR